MQNVQGELVHYFISGERNRCLKKVCYQGVFTSQKSQSLTLARHVVCGVDTFEPLLSQHEASLTSAREPRVGIALRQVERSIERFGDKVLRRGEIEGLITQPNGYRWQGSSSCIGGEREVSTKGTGGDDGGSRDRMEDIEERVTEEARFRSRTGADAINTHKGKPTPRTPVSVRPGIIVLVSTWVPKLKLLTLKAQRKFVGAV